MSRHDIFDEKWVTIWPMLAKASIETRGRKRKDDRLMFSAILWLMKTGAPWRDLHPEFRPWKTVHKRFLEWAKLEVVVDALGNPLRIHLTAGNVNVIVPACDLIEGLRAGRISFLQPELMMPENCSHWRNIKATNWSFLQCQGD